MRNRVTVPHSPSWPRPASATRSSSRGGKHLQVRWTAPGGQTRTLVVPGTPSDWRAVENTRHDLRKILRGDWMLATPEPRPAPTNGQAEFELLERRLAEVERRLGIGRS